MQDRIAEVQTALNRANLPFGARKVHPMRLDTYEFKLDKKDYNVYWDVRKGLIPIVGGARETGDHRVCPAGLLHTMWACLVWESGLHKATSHPSLRVSACLHLLFEQRAACKAALCLHCMMDVL